MHVIPNAHDDDRWLQPPEPRDLSLSVSFKEPVEGVGAGDGLLVYQREVRASAVRQDNGQTQFIDVDGAVVAAWDSGLIEQIDWPDGVGLAPTTFRRWGMPRRPLGPSRISKLRESRPNAYMRWEPDDDERLAAEFHDGTSVSEMADLLGRGESAILSRLIKLNLVSRDNQPPDAT